MCLRTAGITDLYIGLGSGSIEEVYMRELEQAVLQASDEFYTRASSGWLQEYSLPQYLKTAEVCVCVCVCVCDVGRLSRVVNSQLPCIARVCLFRMLLRRRTNVLTTISIGTHTHMSKESSDFG